MLGRRNGFPPAEGGRGAFLRLPARTSSLEDICQVSDSCQSNARCWCSGIWQKLGHGKVGSLKQQGKISIKVFL